MGPHICEPPPKQTKASRPGQWGQFWRRLARRTIAWLQVGIYRWLLKTEVVGGEFIPASGGFLVAANHASHLDAGLVKVALGRRGRQLRALAAKDYFFAQAWSRWYFENLTNVLPFERNGGFRGSFRRALQTVGSGMPLLIFPEGTRSTTGRLGAFKPAISSMALAAGCPIVPIYLEGTHAALPKGSGMLRRRRIGAKIGRPLTAAFLTELTAGLSRHEAYRQATAALELTIRALASGEVLTEQQIAARLRQEGGPQAAASYLATG